MYYLVTVKLKLFSCLNSTNKVLLIGNYFSLRQEMTTRNKRKLAALNKENCEENPRSNMAQNSGAPRSQEDYITQVSEEIEGRVKKRLSKEFSRTENRILGALARLDDFLMNPLLPGHSGTTPEPTRNTSHNNQGTNADGSQNDPHPEAGLFHGQTTRNVSLEDDHDIYRLRKRSIFFYLITFQLFGKCFPFIVSISNFHQSYISSKKYFFTSCPILLLVCSTN